MGSDVLGLANGEWELLFFEDFDFFKTALTMIKQRAVVSLYASQK